MSKLKKRHEPVVPVDGTPPADTGRESIHGHNADYGDRVAQRAYELYLARGAAEGRDFDDWLAAERELTHGHDRGDETDV